MHRTIAFPHRHTEDRTEVLIIQMLFYKLQKDSIYKQLHLAGCLAVCELNNADSVIVTKRVRKQSKQERVMD